MYYNIEQRRMNVVYFKIDINNIWQSRSSVVIFNVEFHNFDQRRNNDDHLQKVEQDTKMFLSFKKKSRLNTLNSKFRLLF